MTEPTDLFSEAIPLPNELPGFRPFVAIRATLALFGVFVAAVALFCFLSGIDPTEGLIAAAVLASPFLLLAIFSRARLDAASAVPHSVSCLNGRLIDRSCETRLSIPLCRCAWFVGQTTDDTRLEPSGVARPCLVVVLPPDFRIASDHLNYRRNLRYIACGLTPEADVRWREAFERYECRRVWRDRGLPGLLLVVAMLLIGAIGIALSAVLARALSTHLLGPLGFAVPEWVVTFSLVGLLMPVVFQAPELLPPWRFPGNRARQRLRPAIAVGPFLMLFVALPSIEEWIPSLLWTAAVALLGFGCTSFLPTDAQFPEEDSSVGSSVSVGKS